MQQALDRHNVRKGGHIIQFMLIYVQPIVSYFEPVLNLDNQSYRTVRTASAKHRQQIISHVHPVLNIDNESYRTYNQR